MAQSSQENVLFVALGHHKCATMWVHTIASELCRETGRRFGEVFKPPMFDGELGRYVERERLDFLGYGNAHFDYVKQLPLDRVRGFHYVRDPRDIVASAYFSHLYSHSTENWPELIAHREKLKTLSKEDGLMLDIDFRSVQFEEMASWKEYEGNAIRTYRMEDLTRNPYPEMLRLFRWLGLLDEEYYSPAKRVHLMISKAFRRLEYLFDYKVKMPFAPTLLPAERFLGIVWENDFEKKAGRKKGQEDSKSHYRKGVAGDWINHFTPRHIEHFKARYNNVLLMYGYETEENWEEQYLDQIEERMALERAS